MNVYLLDITSVPEQAVSEYADVLDADRKKRIAQYRRSADKRRSFGAGMALLYAWRMQYKEQIMPQTARDENGKPFFVGAAAPFCLSHSGKYAACVLGTEKETAIGLDIQEPRKVRAGVSVRFFSDGEQKQLDAGSDPCLIWSRKESLAKYRGSGLRGSLRLLDTAGEQSCRSTCLEAEGVPCQYACQEAEGVPCQYACQGAEGVSCQYACQGAEGTSCQTADAAAHIWSCCTPDGYAISVCTKEAVICRLVYLTWEQMKGIL